MIRLAVWVALYSAGVVSIASTQAPDSSLVLPRPDSVLQAALRRVLSESPFRPLVARRQLSVALVDLSDSTRLRYAGVEDNRMRYAASLPKIAIMLGVFDQIEHGNLEYTLELRSQLEGMIRRSDMRCARTAPGPALRKGVAAAPPTGGSWRPSPIPTTRTTTGPWNVWGSTSIPSFSIWTGQTKNWRR